MNQQRRTASGIDRRDLASQLVTRLASLFASLFASLLAPLAMAGDSSLAAPGDGGPDHRPHGPAVYSMINLPAEEGAAACLNDKGQVAYSSFNYGSAGFFDGERMHDLGSLGGGFTAVRGLNRLGVVVGDTTDASEPFGAQRAFAWTAARGMWALAGPSGASARGINDRNQVVGTIPAAGISARAVRWDPGARLRPLGPVPLSLSEGWVINQFGTTGGFADVAGGSIHATLWDTAGRVTDLGTMGGLRGFTYFVNNRGAAAGIADDAGNEHELAFYWSGRGGRIPIGARDAGYRLVTALNDRGEVSGNTILPSGYAAYFWSRASGLVPLPSAGATYTDVIDMNNRGDMVGAIGRVPGAGTRAVRWPGLATPIDLGSRVLRPPPGLVIHAATAVNDAGHIVAHSNAGLVLLRPGSRGTDAPVLGPIAGLPDTVDVDQEVRLSLGFVDNSPTQVHRAQVDWSDGCASPHPLLREWRGVGKLEFQHRFCAPGFQTVTVKITDSGGRETEVRRQVFVNMPGLAVISGSGALHAGAGGAPLRFTLWAPLGGGGGGGVTADLGADPAAAGASAKRGWPFISLSGPFQFRADQVGKAVTNGRATHMEGIGRYNGRPGYRFHIEASQAGAGQQADKDRMRVRISHDEAGKGEVVDYDNGVAPSAKYPAGTGRKDRTVLVEGRLRLRN